MSGRPRSVAQSGESAGGEHGDVERAIERGGTATGEHGIGTHKREHLRDEFNDATLAVMRQLKQSIDPAGILNPNTAIPNPSA